MQLAGTSTFDRYERTMEIRKIFLTKLERNSYWEEYKVTPKITRECNAVTCGWICTERGFRKDLLLPKHYSCHSRIQQPCQINCRNNSSQSNSPKEKHGYNTRRAKIVRLIFFRRRGKFSLTPASAHMEQITQFIVLTGNRNQKVWKQKHAAIWLHPKKTRKSKAHCLTNLY